MGYFQEKYAELREAELEAKIAALESYWADQPENLDAVGEAYDHIKEAEEAGKFGEGTELDDSQRLSLAVEMVQEVLRSEDEDAGTETAEVEETPETAEVDEVDEVDEGAEKVAEYYDLAVAIGRELSARGLSSDDLQKFASDEESEQFGQLLAEVAVSLVEK